MKNNRIPRSAKALKVTYKIDTTAANVGDTVKLYKNDHGWVGLFPNNKFYYCFVSMLRNSAYCDIEVLEA